MRKMSVKYPYNISISLYGDRFATKDWIGAFISIAEQWKVRLSIEYTWFGCNYYDGEEIKDKEFRYIKRNMKRIEQLLSAKEIRSISFTVIERGVDQVRDIESMIYLAEPGRSPHTWEPYHHFYFLVVPEVLKPMFQAGTPFNFFLSVMQEVEAQLMNVCYGLIHPMVSEKLAALYFMNISNEHLSPSEKEKLFIWKGSNREFATKIWGAFWGNVLTDKHLGAHRAEILAQIRDIVGPENLVEWAEGKYFFAVPVDILDFLAQRHRLEEYTQRLEDMFAKYNLLMTQDIRDVVAKRVKELESKG